MKLTEEKTNDYFESTKKRHGNKGKSIKKRRFCDRNLFGKEIKGSVPLKIDKKEADQLLKTCLKGSQLFVELDGKKYDVLLKEIDYDPIKKQVLELDFQALVKGEVVHSVAEIVLHNREKVVDGILEQLLSEVSYKALPEALVDRIDVDCSSLRLGDTLKVADLDIAKHKDLTILTDLETAVVSVVTPHNKAVEQDGEQEAAEEETEK